MLRRTLLHLMANNRRRRSRMVSMADVASTAGVSMPAVSHVVNGTRFVSSDLRARIGRGFAKAVICFTR